MSAAVSHIGRVRCGQLVVAEDADRVRGGDRVAKVIGQGGEGDDAGLEHGEEAAGQKSGHEAAV